jgi:hypothetical protein
MIDEIRERAEAMIAEHGHMIQHVFADHERGLPSLSYSVGLQDLGWPELVLTGVDARHAHLILNRAVAFLKERGQAPREGEIVGELFGGDYPCRFRALSEAEVAANLLLACARSREIGRSPPKAFQMVYQDPEHRWPEDFAYSCRMALMLAQSREETRQ